MAGHGLNPVARLRGLAAVVALACFTAQGAAEDAGLAARVARIAVPLEAAAARERPETSTWNWEVSVTSDPAIAAYCLAGGKVVVGSAFVARLGLDDAELAMLLAHEMAHAVAGHRRPRPAADAMEADPAAALGEQRRAMAQEEEADRLGMVLAARAGWAPAKLLGFFDKLAASEPAGSFSATHARAADRIVQAREVARQLGAGARP